MCYDAFARIKWEYALLDFRNNLDDENISGEGDASVISEMSTRQMPTHLSEFHY